MRIPDDLTQNIQDENKSDLFASLNKGFVVEKTEIKQTKNTKTVTETFQAATEKTTAIKVDTFQSGFNDVSTPTTTMDFDMPARPSTALAGSYSRANEISSYVKETLDFIQQKPTAATPTLQRKKSNNNIKTYTFFKIILYCRKIQTVR